MRTTIRSSPYNLRRGTARANIPTAFTTSVRPVAPGTPGDSPLSSIPGAYDSGKRSHVPDVAPAVTQDEEPDKVSDEPDVVSSGTEVPTTSAAAAGDTGQASPPAGNEAPRHRRVTVEEILDVDAERLQGVQVAEEDHFWTEDTARAKGKNRPDAGSRLPEKLAKDPPVKQAKSHPVPVATGAHAAQPGIVINDERLPRSEHCPEGTVGVSRRRLVQETRQDRRPS